MIDKIYALGTWEMHLWTKEEKDYIVSKMKNCCTYFDTAIDYNNDYLLKLGNGFDNYKIISKISSYHSSKYDFFVDNHFKCLGRDKIDIMLIHSNRGDWKSLVKKLENDNRFSEVGVSNFTSSDIEEYKKIAGRYPSYNEIEINPFYTDIETIDFCKKNGIKIIAYGVFGGKYNAMTYIADFSIPYLLSYAAHFADIIILKPESYRQVNEILDVVNNYSYDNINSIKLQKVLDNKSIEPMRYFAKDIKRLCYGFETYVNWCGNNIDKIGLTSTLVYESGFDNKNIAKIDVPQFEMLGDYLVYLRYLLKSHYDTPAYMYDFLVGDDAMYVVYLYDDKDRISKINKFGKVRIFKIQGKTNDNI